MTFSLEQNQETGQLEKKVAPEGVAVLPEEVKREERVVIHTMPKRFISTSAGSNKAKSVGVLIMSVGAVFLIAIAVFLYFFVLKPGVKNSPVLENNTEKTEEVEKNNDSLPQEKDKEIPSEDDDVTTIKDLTENKTEPEKEEQLDENMPPENEADEIIPVIATSTVPENKSPDLKIALDTDKDGLSDIEERMFGSIVNLKDSDSDGYDDLAETLGLYNPAGEGSIMVNPNIEKYTNDKYGYSLYYLKKQSVEKAGGGDDSIIFKLESEQFIQVIVEENKDKLALEDWYKKQFEAQAVKSEQIIYKKGWTGIRSKDGLVAYLSNDKDGNIYIISYNVGTDYVLNYKNVAEMMINSLEIK